MRARCKPTAQQAPMRTGQVVLRNPVGFEAIDDLTALRFLDAPNLLHSLALRFKEDKIYTYTGRHMACGHKSATGRAIGNRCKWPRLSANWIHVWFQARSLSR